jgi:hypothetical protein
MMLNNLVRVNSTLGAAGILLPSPQLLPYRARHPSVTDICSASVVKCIG